MKPVLITNDCRSEIDEVVQTWPVLAEKIENFVEFRQTHPDHAMFSAKDSYFSSTSPLKGYRHVHLHHGKCILIYQITSQAIFLMAICDHDAEDAPNPLVRRLRNYTRADFFPFEAPEQADPPESTNHNFRAEISDAIFEMVASDPDIVRQSLRGDPALVEYLSILGSPERIVGAFGGPDKFAAFLRKALSDYGVREGLRDWMNIIRGSCLPDHLKL